MYDLKWHKTLGPRWKELPPAQQILHIAGELRRAGNLLGKADVLEAKNALERAFELIDLTIDNNRSANKTIELLRFREMLGTIFLQEKIDIDFLEKLYQVLITLDKDSYQSLSLK